MWVKWECMVCGEMNRWMLIFLLLSFLLISRVILSFVGVNVF